MSVWLAALVEGQRGELPVQVAAVELELALAVAMTRALSCWPALLVAPLGGDSRALGVGAGAKPVWAGGISSRGSEGRAPTLCACVRERRAMEAR